MVFRLFSEGKKWRFHCCYGGHFWHDYAVAWSCFWQKLQLLFWLYFGRVWWLNCRVFGHFFGAVFMGVSADCLWLFGALLDSELLGLPLIPAYTEASADTSGDKMRYGVNYASAAAGILDITGRNFVGRIPFNRQIKNFENTLDQITDNLGAPDVAQALAKCMFFVGMGSNDYLNNYLMPNYDTKNRYNPQQYANLLVQQYSQQLTRLYNLGARKFVIGGVGLMGCIPSILAQGNGNVCSEEVNQLVLPFSNNVKSMLSNLNTNLPGSKFIYADIKNMFQDLLTNYRRYGFSVINRGCCGIGRNRGQITCLPLQTPCPNRDQYIFWDAFHPTEAVNILFGRRAFNGGPELVYPINIQQLAAL
ncbi:GDSL esterase/lipase At1g71691-like [Nicotiana sylvestris]|uniref:GDSL esterase/lipase At1g71691-like n=1 Tax=Nicotiana sylvestris TaxID=4096 RepID=UPI00388C8383